MKNLQMTFAALVAVALIGCGEPEQNTDAGTTTGGGTGGGMTTTGGGSGGGNTETGGGTGGGSEETDAGPTDAGVDDAGVTDAGTVDCATLTLDAQLGSYTLASGATVLNSVALPASVWQVAVSSDGGLFGLSNSEIVALGSPHAPVLGTSFADVTAASDGGATYVSGYLAASGSRLMAGFTSSDFTGVITVVETRDGGVSTVSSTGNYDAVGTNFGFLINALDFSTETGGGLYGYAGTFPITMSTFPTGASSGNVGWTTNGVGLVGYYDSTAFANVLKAVPDSQFSTPPFALAAEADVVTGPITDVASAGENAVVVMGEWEAPQNVYVYPTAKANGAVTVGAQAPLLTTTNTCTSIAFVASNGASVLINLQDRNGSRLLDIKP